MKRVVLAVVAAACTAPTTSVEHELSAAAKRERSTLIRDSAASMGVYNAALFGGIAISETQLAHCWSEATYACKGPASSSCGDGPIIAGSADGPCANEQGGLGMFQFDAGTYAQTLAMYGDDILTVEGNTAQAVAYVIDRVMRVEPGATDWLAAAEWINAVPLEAGDPVTEEWGRLMACEYNGCCSGSTLCMTRAAGYRDNAIALHEEMGAEFWHTRDRCRAIPDGGVIDQRTACYVAAGEPRTWHREDAGYNDNREWTPTTDAPAATSFARWLLRPGRGGMYRIEVFASGGTVKGAPYTIAHAGLVDTVVVDQSLADGFVLLGDFELAADGAEYVELANNLRTRDERLVFDALRVTSLDGGGEEGSCATTGRGGLGLVVLVVLGLVRRRRRRRA